MKILSHRLRDGRCRDCGTFDSGSAPLSCPRCALEVMRELGHPILIDPRAAFAAGHELWRWVVADLQAGIIKADRFFVYVGHDDGEPLGLPEEGVVPGGSTRMTRPGIQALATDLTARYPGVWVVTTVGCWNAVRLP